MRHRVVRVHDVEVLVAGDLHDLGRERQQILRLAKQGITRRFHPMERQTGLILAKTERRVAAQNVDVVPTLPPIEA